MDPEKNLFDLQTVQKRLALNLALHHPATLTRFWSSFKNLEPLKD